jgi:hypothetical protein
MELDIRRFAEPGFTAKWQRVKDSGFSTVTLNAVRDWVDSLTQNANVGNNLSGQQIIQALLFKLHSAVTEHDTECTAH